jgi:hypothetical protein
VGKPGQAGFREKRGTCPQHRKRAVMATGFSVWSITNEQNALQRKLKSPADVECLKETLNFGKIVRITIVVAHSYRKMKNVMHHARLKNILEKLIVVNGATRLDLKNPPFSCGVGVSIETFQYLAFAPKKHWNNYFVFAGLPFLDPESELFPGLGAVVP